MADPKAVCFIFPSLVNAKLLYEKTLASRFVCGTPPPRFQMSRAHFQTTNNKTVDLRETLQT
jgi:hypothetical protein